MVETHQAVLGVAGAETESPYFIFGLKCPELRATLPICETLPKLPPRFNAPWHAVDFEVFKAVFVFLHADGVGAPLGLAILLPGTWLTLGYDRQHQPRRDI